MIGERLQRARKAAGVSLRVLADQTDLSHTTIDKFEKEKLKPSSSQLIKMAKVLGVRTEYFFRSDVITIQTPEYRKKTTLAKKVLNKIEGDIFDQAERWHELLNLYPKSPIESFSLPANLLEFISTETQIEDLAVTMRHAWELGLGCIPDLIDTLESQGIMVISTAVKNDEKFDGLTSVVNDIPLIVVDANWVGDRQRFTLAHELGHLLLKNRIAESDNEEKWCNHFAGAFLLPKATLISHLGEHRHNLEPRELYLLKHEFGLSMQGVLFRAKQAEIITQATFERICRMFSMNGWRKCEPQTQYPSEKTILFKQLVYRALAEDYISESKAAELLGLSVIKFHQQRTLDFDPVTH
jgi:Zn-dependent peptidase ImmA (M78 family)/DNA-binding XRE family transcriptional regulator